MIRLGPPLRRCRSLVGIPLLVAAAMLFSGPLAADTLVRVGVIGAISDAPFFIGDKMGYFRDEGITVDIINFKESSQMTAPLGTGEIQVGAGAPSAGLYNALGRGIDIRAVADKGSMPHLYGYTVLTVRKDLVESGKFKSLKDLKGLKLGSQSPGGAATATLDRALKQVGLKFSDFDIAYMGHPQLATAIDNGAIDAAFITEPNATHAVRLGKAVRFARGDEVYPDQQLAVVLYSGKFAKDQPEIARKFMVAYLRAARAYNDALKDGKFAGPAADEIIKLLTQATPVKDASIYREIVPSGCHPDGKLNVESMQSDLDTFKEQGLVKGNVTAAQLVDASFAEEAAKKLGPYRPAR
jgi:NitT/TauT family transport system substrate-binding protein